jgi:hypothetical protein
MPYVRGTFTGERSGRLPDLAIYREKSCGPCHRGSTRLARESKKSSGEFISWAKLAKIGKSTAYDSHGKVLGVHRIYAY